MGRGEDWAGHCCRAGRRMALFFDVACLVDAGRWKLNVGRQEGRLDCTAESCWQARGHVFKTSVSCCRRVQARGWETGIRGLGLYTVVVQGGRFLVFLLSTSFNRCWTIGAGMMVGLYVAVVLGNPQSCYRARKDWGEGFCIEGLKDCCQPFGKSR